MRAFLVSGADGYVAEADGHAGKAGMASMRHRTRRRSRHVLMVGADQRGL